MTVPTEKLPIFRFITTALTSWNNMVSKPDKFPLATSFTMTC